MSSNAAIVFGLAALAGVAYVITRSQPAQAGDGINWSGLDAGSTDTSGDAGQADGSADATPTTVDNIMTKISDTAAAVLGAGQGYTDIKMADGTTVRRTGTRAWRNNNPGNIMYTPWSIAHGAVGTDGRFAIFPTYEAGRAAKEALLFDSGTYRNLVLTDAIAKWAPAFENKTSNYQANVLASVGGLNQAMQSYSSDQRAAIMDAMERQEGYKVGQTTVLEGVA